MQVLNLMAEYYVDTPLWYVNGPEVGPIDGDEFGLSAGLQDELRMWNDTFERMYDDEEFARSERARDFAARAFELTAAVQRELGREFTISCGAGGGLGALRDAGQAVYDRVHRFRYLLLRGPAVGRRPGLIEWRFRGERTPDAEQWGLTRPTMKAVHAWVGSARRVSTEPTDPGGVDPAEYRARGAEVAAAVQRDIGERGSVLWFGGEDVPV